MKRLFCYLVGSILILHAANGSLAQDKVEGKANLSIPETDEGLPGAGPLRRMDWFKQLWNRKRTEWSTKIQQDQGSLVFLGDSITQEWGEQFQGAFQGAKLANRGISGDTTRGMLIRLSQDVLSLHPKGVVILMGTNDLEEGAEPETIAGNAKLILDKLKQSDSKMPIVLCSVFPSSETKKRPADKIQKLNALYAATVKGDPQITWLDTWTLFANESGDAKVQEFPDLLHPNEKGYQRWQAALQPVLEFLELVPVESKVEQPKAGYVSLFNGKDLSGWKLRPSSDQDRKARENWLKRDPQAAVWPLIEKEMPLDGKAATPDARYVAKHGRLIVSTPPEGRRIQQLWTTAEYAKDFDLELEFRATPNADSGIFLRGKQLQCRDFLVAGPYKELKQYRPQDWNKIRVEVRGTNAKCTCNDEVLEMAFDIPTSGPIGLEGDRGQMEYRNIWFRELP